MSTLSMEHSGEECKGGLMLLPVSHMVSTDLSSTVATPLFYSPLCAEVMFGPRWAIEHDLGHLLFP